MLRKGGGTLDIKPDLLRVLYTYRVKLVGTRF